MSINPNKKKQDLERLMAKYFDEYQSLQLLRSQLNEALKTGYFLMSKSRMSMGLKSLGQLQYPENMKSSVLIKKPIDSDCYIDLTKDCYTVQTKEEIQQNHNNNNHSQHHKQQQQQTPQVLQDDDEEDNVSPFSQYNGTSSNTTASSKTATTAKKIEEDSQTRKRATATTEKSDNNNNSSNGNKSNGGMMKSTSMNRIEQLLDSATLTESFTSNGNNGRKHIDTADHTTSDDEYDDFSSDDYSDDDKDRVSQKMVSLTNRVKRQKKKSLKANPIYWFGFLTPTTLKQSQSQFNQGKKKKKN
ncbi:hypothetical protein PPL_09976 [Heterostelium album PN500]|uniref:Vacuolar ATPase assembly protein VMA22 n=1 Tax=Heterostelium pallidum (strain ATCC 26659 / Pp 5 / PN500) TaxID=670386 RepID=D3BPT2_HETP5|nr:hypothetical protein PPL_09976 [Heterostelium album PN500]EFA76215.1 hypothetical protein PPL_09976 [Heterostelium album PN500]|eukprot:XP_020428348.1 hypothetical protein PPL_09976 [Heterostelium album PN500]